MTQHLKACCFCLFCLVFLASCRFTNTDFERTVTNAGATFAAGAVTLQYVHQGKLPLPYARSTFEQLVGTIAGTDQQLATLEGAPPLAQIKPLLASFRPAFQALKQPCLTNTCNWQTQYQSLQTASRLFQEAGKS